MVISIDVFSDPVCPWCFIGKRRLEEALQARPEIETEIRWHCFQLNPMMPREGMSREDYLALKFGNTDNARKLYTNISGIGEQAGIPFRFDRILIIPNTVNAHRLIRLAGQHGLHNEIVEQLFIEYFLHGMDIGKTNNLISLASSQGLNASEIEAYLKSSEDFEAIKREDMRARQLGIQGVPFFIIDRQYAISGAQEAEAFYPLFDLLVAEALQSPRTRALPS
ncbi:MAG: hypothetical protein CFH10_00310 [Alphaproteobacteria bacterium MarineAlpha4_Bin2]|nr:MAG: hypothetical protein CFH10_00310 [Alphaproteobacteria bacterium MarineAlpha4_Bin2]